MQALDSTHRDTCVFAAKPWFSCTTIAIKGKIDMQIIEPKYRPRPFLTARTHARLCHDYATWHEAHRREALRATGAKLPYENKSKFDSSSIISDAISKSHEHPALRAGNGNHVITFDMGHQVGFDAVAKRRTSSVTVVVSPRGEVITAHPGTPWSKDQTEA